MKKFILLSTCLLFCIISLPAQDIIISHPDFEDSNCQYFFDIDRITLNDRETVLHCDIYDFPEEPVFLSSTLFLTGNQTGKTYPFSSISGFETDKEIEMPESGNISFTLHFPPLDKEDTSFDLRGKTEEGNIKISNIQTVKEETVPGKIRCVLQGEVIGRPYSSRLMLNRKNEDMRIKTTYIPIKEGKFSYTLDCEHEEAYQIIFFDEFIGNGWQSILFFTSNDTIRFKLYPREEFKRNQVEGGETNREYALYKEYLYSQDLWDEITDLYNKRSHLYQQVYELQRTAKKITDENERQAIHKELQALKEKETDEFYSKEIKALEEEQERRDRDTWNWKIKQAEEHPSLVSYFSLIDLAFWYNEDSDWDIIPIFQLFETKYAGLYPDHPYTEEFRRLILTHNQIKPGGKFIDFTAPDFNGNPITLSSQIDGKIALINLWASWCFPCRIHSIDLIPLYEKYKDQGFTVIGIARENRSEDGINAAKKDGYPWLNLLEIKDAAKIWYLYGIGNGAGKMILVDRDGTILAIPSDTEELEKILDEIL